ncbi:MAG: hypothetical protein V1887_02295 [Candidatus Aenigmatarchaeota archaeon]
MAEETLAEPCKYVLKGCPNGRTCSGGHCSVATAVDCTLYRIYERLLPDTDIPRFYRTMEEQVWENLRYELKN